MYLLGANDQGQDMLSRIIFGARVSMSIGLVGVALSFVFGVFLGGISGYYAGATDTVIQRLIEVLMSIPTLPLWLGLSAALPPIGALEDLLRDNDHPLPDRLDGPGQGRRGRFLSLRGEDFVTAAELDGSSKPRIILRHMLPSFASHVIASLTLAVPAMILAETALSFLGLGLQPPIVSWGVLLQGPEHKIRRHRAVAPAARVRRDNRGPGAELHGRRPERLGRPLCQVRAWTQTTRCWKSGTQDPLLPRRGGRKGRGRRGPQGPPRRDPVRGRKSGCGKSVTARSILQLVDRPGRIVEGEILFSHTPQSESNGKGRDRWKDGDCDRSAGGPRPRVAGPQEQGHARHPRQGDLDDLPGADDVA